MFSSSWINTTTTSSQTSPVARSTVKVGCPKLVSELVLRWSIPDTIKVISHCCPLLQEEFYHLGKLSSVLRVIYWLLLYYVPLPRLEPVHEVHEGCHNPRFLWLAKVRFWQFWQLNKVFCFKLKIWPDFFRCVRQYQPRVWWFSQEYHRKQSTWGSRTAPLM